MTVRRFLLALLLAWRAAGAQHLLLPMDEAQANHLKAYGVVFGALVENVRSEWLINYRGGAFLVPDLPSVRRAAALAGVSAESVDGAALATMRREIAEGNMDAVPLERAPRIAVYTPPDSPPWDDAVTLALSYAGIKYAKIWDDTVLATDLAQFDWIHLFHEDFTGQQNKLHLGFRDAPWFVQARERDLAMARRNGLADIPALKKAVAEKLRAFVERGILPTVAYVAGPGELAYFAQVGAVAEALGVPAPVAVPRWSASIVDPQTDRRLGRLGLVIEDLRDSHAAERRLGDRAIPIPLRTELESLRAEVQRRMQAMLTANAAEGELIAERVLEGARQQIFHRLDRLERRIRTAARGRETEAMADLAAVRAILMPEGHRQERRLNLVPLLARHGETLLAQLRAGAAMHAGTLVVP